MSDQFVLHVARLHELAPTVFPQPSIDFFVVNLTDEFAVGERWREVLAHSPQVIRQLKVVTDQHHGSTLALPVFCQIDQEAQDRRVFEVGLRIQDDDQARVNVTFDISKSLLDALGLWGVLQWG